MAGGAAAVGSLALLAYLVSGHIGFPAYLEIMEGTVLQHFQRAAAGLPVYVEPSPEFVALAYNPLYYYSAIPLSWIFGVNLVALRALSVLAMAGIAAVLFAAVRRETRSAWWGLGAAGLFAAAYKAQDAYLDSAHTDSSMLFCALLGTYLLSRGWTLAGTAALLAGFWFKQHGALFAIGGLAWIAWSQGIRRALPAIALAAVAGPGIYIFAGPALFGPQFHFFTWQTPRAWSQFEMESLLRLPRLLLKPYLLPAAAGLWLFVRSVRQPGVWHVQLAMATASALMGALDPGSSNNVFAGWGLLLIVWGVRGFHALPERWGSIAMLAAYLPLAYNPLDYRAHPDAHAAWAGFRTYVKGLPGSVAIPKFGPMPDGTRVQPAAHWVAMIDLVRGPGRNEQNHPLTKRLMSPEPEWLLMHNPLEPDPLLGHMADRYERQADLGDRFRPIGNVPHRFDVVWPRYLYRRKR